MAKDGKGTFEEIKSPLFFLTNSKRRTVVYDDNEERTPLDVIQSGFKELGTLATFHMEAPRMENVALSVMPTAQLKPGQCLTTIKYLCQRTSQDKERIQCQFFFVYKGYDAMLKSNQDRVNEFCAMAQKEDQYHVQSILEVPIGGLFGYKVNKVWYTRVRIVAINFRTRVLTYWAVDEGNMGTCFAKDLLHLSGDCLKLNMLVVPGEFEEVPKPDVLKKFEEKKYCLAIVTQPKLFCDFGPRKIILTA